MYNEISSFLKWMLFNPVTFFNFFFKKIVNRFNKNNIFNYYPDEISTLIFKYLKKKNQHIKFFDLTHSKWKNSKFIDNEKYEKIHRLNIDYNKKKNLKKFNNWYKKYYKEIFNKSVINTDLKWHSYTLSERIINTIKFIEKNNKGFKKYLYPQIFLLLLRLEYFGNNTSNHIINNARAIIFCGIILEDEQLINIGKKILKKAITQFINKEGLLRESSTSYQFLITSWLLEIYKYSKLKNKKNKFKFLEKILNKMTNSCSFFKVKKYFCIFGDTSPDLNIKNLDKKIRSYKSKKKFNKRFKDNYILKLGDFYKIKYDNFIVFINFKKDGLYNYPCHQHDENFHFNLYYKSKPFLTDLNRLNYKSLNGVDYKSHNTISMDGKGCLPMMFKKLPFNYSKSKNVLNFKFTKNSFKVLMKSDCFSRLKKNIFYQRLLEINNKNILISDNIKNHNYSFITLAFHLCPEVKLKKIYNNTFQIRNGPTRLNFKINSKKIKKIKNDYVFDYGKKISTNSFVINNFSKKNFSNKVIIGN